MNAAMLNNLTIEEKLRFGVTLSGNDLEEFALETQREAERCLEKCHESPLEQSEFRAEALREILAICKHSPRRYKETKELIQRIESYIENSYVEL